jgi:hypothetical protein
VTIPCASNLREGRRAQQARLGLAGGGQPPPELKAAGVRRLNASLLVQLVGAALWLALATWRLTDVPGMSMDEAWSIMSASGQVERANPLSGMSSYTAPLPILLVQLLGPEHGLLALRGASVLANGSTLVLIALLLRGLFSARALRGWALPLIATCPVWLIVMRTGIEIAMFTPLLALLGVYLFSRGTSRAVLGAGVAWGLLLYNHLIGIWVLASLALAWLVAFHGWLPRHWRPLLAGLCLGLLPRCLALLLYPDEQIAGLVRAQSFASAIADLHWLPLMFWQTLTGTTVYLRYVGRVALDVEPYWLIAPSMLLPWVSRLRSVPRHAWFVLVAVVAFGVLVTLGAPYMAVRFFVLPAIGLSVLVVVLGAGAIDRDARWAYVVRAMGILLVVGNLFYLLNDFYLPWQRRELGSRAFFLGERSPRMGSWVYLPKDELVRELLKLDPAPEQVLANASLSRPLQVLLRDTGIRVSTWEAAHNSLRSVLVDYRSGNNPRRRCVTATLGRMCFRGPTIIDSNYVLYR